MFSDIIYPELKTTGKLSFNCDNYLIWKPKILFVLADYGVDDVLTTSDSTTDPQWRKRDQSARFLHILPSLDDHFRAKYANYSTAKSIMDSLENRFNCCDFTTKTDLLRLYCDHKMQPNVRINEHIFRMRAMAKELEYAGLNVPEQMQAVLLLNSVPEDWRGDVESVQLGSHGREEELSVDNAILRLRIANDFRKWKNYVNNKSKKGFKVTCNNCGKKGHRKPDCPEEASRAQGGFLLVDQDRSLTGIVYPQLKTRDRLDSSGSNFFKWEYTLSIMFDDNEVNYVLTDPKPPEEDVDCHKKWLADDLLCRHLMLGAVDNDLFLSFHGYPSAKALMDAIKAFFNFSSNARCMLLLKKYMDCQMSEDTSITDHTTKMEMLAWKLERAGVTIPDEVQAVFLMDSLPESWNDTLTALRLDMNLKKKVVDFDTVRRRLWDVGYIRNSMARQNETEMSSKKFVMKSRKVVKGNCFSCGRQGHYASNCPNTGQN